MPCLCPASRQYKGCHSKLHPTVHGTIQCGRSSWIKVNSGEKSHLSNVNFSIRTVGLGGRTVSTWVPIQVQGAGHLFKKTRLGQIPVPGRRGRATKQPSIARHCPPQAVAVPVLWPAWQQAISHPPCPFQHQAADSSGALEAPELGNFCMEFLEPRTGIST